MAIAATRGQRSGEPIASACAGAPREERVAQRIEAGLVGDPAGSNDHVPGRDRLHQLPSPQFSEPPAQTIAGHRAGLELRNDESHPRMARLIVRPPHIEKSEGSAVARPLHSLEVRFPMQSGRARKPLVRQRPPCFEGTFTVRRLRPFFRRRDNTSRPHRSAIRARKPCLFRRLRLRGRYVGCMQFPGIL